MWGQQIGGSNYGNIINTYMTYIFGGRYNDHDNDVANTFNSIQKWDGINRTTESETLEEKLVDTSSSRLNAYIYIIGGTGPAGLFGKIQKWDSITRTTESSVSTAPVNHASSKLGSYIFSFAGAGTGLIYSWDGTNWVTRSNFGSSRYGLSASTLGSYAYIFGGYTSPNFLMTINKYVLDTLTTESATLSIGSQEHSSSTRGSYAYIFGGYTPTWESLIQKWDGTTRTTESATLANKLYRHSSATLSWYGL